VEALVLVFLASVLAAPVVAAPRSDTHLDLFAGTDFPVAIGGKVRAELPYRLQTNLSLGYYPGGYLNLLNGTAEAAGWWDENTSSLINSALKNSLVAQLSVGWRPWADRGWFFGVGYQLITLGGGLADVDAIEAVTGVEVDAQTGQVIEAEAAAQMHQLTAEIGWQWIIRERWVLRTTVGGLTTLGSSTQIETSLTGSSAGPGGDLAESALDQLESAGETYLDDFFQQYIHLPSVGIHVGYRFF